MNLATTVFAVGVLSGATASPTPKVPESPLSTAEPGRCESEARKRFGRVAGKSVLKGLKLRKSPVPTYPELPKGTWGTGVGIHDVLLGPDGKVVQVWTLEAPVLDPPFPAFGDAMIAALKQWEYEPLESDGVKMPVCIVVTTHLHWR
jgi:hypothetical protein